MKSVAELFMALKLRAESETSEFEPDWTPSVAEQDYGFARELTACPPPELSIPSETIEEARAKLKNEIQDYLDIEFPEYILLIKATPGTGKTTAAVAAIDELLDGKRVAYAGPRHNFFADVVAKTKNPQNWYEWLPRQLATEDRPETCRNTHEIGHWLCRGYDAINFCSGVCGWDYVNDTCPYHLQKKRPEPNIFVQHQHVSLGHPLDFDVMIGDENPVSAFTHPWIIPTENIYQLGMDYRESLTEMLSRLQTLALSGQLKKPLQGRELLEFLGGAQKVFDACDGFEIPADALQYGATIHHASEAEKKPYWHLRHLVPLLQRESFAALADEPYVERVIVSNDGMTLLLKRDVKKLANHVIWLDATAQPEIYEALFGLPVRVVDISVALRGNVYQVINRSNGKSTLLAGDKTTPKAEQTKKLVEAAIKKHGYKKPMVVTFKGLAPEFENVDSSHFYGIRGTNKFEDADAVFVVGAPMPNIRQVVENAKMIFWGRDRGFRVVWSSHPVKYNYIAPDGDGRQYPVSSFWGDPDLQAVLRMYREEEILQAAHRARPVNHPVDIWLLTNIPVPQLPPTELLTMSDVMEAPDGVDIWRWGDIQNLLETQPVITKKDIMGVGFSENTAIRYFEKIAQMDGWELAVIKTGKRGMPPKALKRNE